MKSYSAHPDDIFGTHTLLVLPADWRAELIGDRPQLGVQATSWRGFGRHGQLLRTGLTDHEFGGHLYGLDRARGTRLQQNGKSQKDCAENSERMGAEHQDRHTSEKVGR
jgi:hypothetical protein